MIKCQHCGKQMKRNLPGVDASEAPYYTETVSVESEHENITTTKTSYYCSKNCIQKALKFR